MTRESIAADLRRLRESAGLTQAELGPRLDRTQSYVSKAETGARGMECHEIAAWAAACNHVAGVVFLPLPKEA